MKFLQTGYLECGGHLHGGDWLDANDVFLTDGDIVAIIYAPMNPADGTYEILDSEHSAFFLLTRDPLYKNEPFSIGSFDGKANFSYAYLK